MDSTKVLLLQFRQEEGTLQHEVECFQKVIDQQADRVFELKTIHLTEDKLDKQICLEGVDRVILAGSGGRGLHKNASAMIQKIHDTIHKAIEKDIPVLGITFGAQIMAMICAGEDHHMTGLAQVGTYETTLTLSGELDELFSGLPSPFLAQYGHMEHIRGLSDECEILAKTERVEIAAFRHKKSRTWGIMFHPELNLDDIHQRLEVYPEFKAEAMQHRLGLKIFQESQQAVKVLENFLRL